MSEEIKANLAKADGSIPYTIANFVFLKLAELQSVNAYARADRPPQRLADVKIERIPDIRFR